MLNLSLNELKQIAKMRRVKGYNNMSKERLLSVLCESKSAESRKNLNNAKIKKIRKDFNKLIRKSYYEIKNKKIFQNQK